MSPSQLRGLKARAPDPFPLSRASPFPLSFTRPLGVFRRFRGVVFVPCGARRRRFYLREGPNGCILRVEVSLPSSGRVRVGRSRWGGKSSQQRQGARRAEKTGW
ncbi:hypothetical protein Taro_009355 [Colocasia esculenta]|uniref:Uncharacterized protein n=1 Tax=Colocasia esculenta TaxID=4460 RepID=A0A843U0N1_COLES|nr:hypothetical protein [Colocasia esculenta]